MTGTFRWKNRYSFILDAQMYIVGEWRADVKSFKRMMPELNYQEKLVMSFNGCIEKMLGCYGDDGKSDQVYNGHEIGSRSYKKAKIEILHRVYYFCERMIRYDKYDAEKKATLPRLQELVKEELKEMKQ